MRLISVVLGTGSTGARKNETRSLLNYGFRFFETLDYFSAAEELERPRVWMGTQDYLPVGVADALVLTVPRGKRKTLERVVEVDPDLRAPIALGDRLGTVKVMAGDELIDQVPLVALQALDENHLFARLWDMILMWVASLFNPG